MALALGWVYRTGNSDHSLLSQVLLSPRLCRGIAFLSHGLNTHVCFWLSWIRMSLFFSIAQVIDFVIFLWMSCAYFRSGFCVGKVSLSRFTMSWWWPSIPLYPHKSLKMYVTVSRLYSFWLLCVLIVLSCRPATVSEFNLMQRTFYALFGPRHLTYELVKCHIRHIYKSTWKTLCPVMCDRWVCCPESVACPSTLLLNKPRLVLSTYRPRHLSHCVKHQNC